MRAEPSHCSEMVSQLLYGETYRVLETLEEWVQIETHHDNYSGGLCGIRYMLPVQGLQVSA